MENKKISPRYYFCYKTETTLQHIQSVADREVDLLFKEAFQFGLEQTGALEFIYFDCTNDITKPFTLYIALPVKEAVQLNNSPYSIIGFDQFNCLSHVHKGDISQLYEVYGKLFGDLFGKGHQPTHQVREVYSVYEGRESAANVTEIQIGIMN